MRNSRTWLGVDFWEIDGNCGADFANEYIQIYICLYECVCMYVYVYMCVYIYTYIHIHMYIYAYI